MRFEPITATDKTGARFLIRAYDPADRQELEAMFDDFSPKRAAQGLPPGDPQIRSGWLSSVLALGFHLVVEVAGEVRGHGMLIPLAAGQAELANFLHQSVRDRGIGTALNRALLTVARAGGIKRIWLSVEPSNRPAVRSYEKVGFQRRPVTGWSLELEMEVELEGTAE